MRIMSDNAEPLPIVVITRTRDPVRELSSVTDPSEPPAFVNHTSFVLAVMLRTPLSPSVFPPYTRTSEPFEAFNSIKVAREEFVEFEFTTHTCDPLTTIGPGWSN
jgi:hypothetical protein